MKKRPRQVDVARLAGVSPATVSLVLNDRIGGNVRISQETRERVLDAVKELGYVANPIARSLAGGRNRLLGVFTYEAIFPIQNHDFYYPFLIGIEEVATSLGYDLLLFTSAVNGAGRRSIYQEGINRLRLADGAILLGHEREKDELLDLVREGFPFVFVGRREVPGTEIAYVAADYVAATADLLGRLFAQGHRRIAYLGVESSAESARDRLPGYELAHTEQALSLDPALVHCLRADAITSPFVNSLLAQGATAFVAEHDDLAAAVIQAAATLKRTIPRDLSLVMLGDPVRGSALPMDVTGFTIPRQEMGARAVHLLVETLADPRSAPRQITLPCTFVPGNTVAAPPEN